MDIKEKFKKAKQKCCDAANKIEGFVYENPITTTWIIIIGSTIAATAAGYYAYKNCEITAGDIVEYNTASGGWIVLDANNNIWWPVNHGLSDEELNEIRNLMAEENICFGEALNQMKLLRFG